MKKAILAICLFLLLSGSQMVSAKMEMETVSLWVLDTQDPTLCGPEAPVTLENVGRVRLRFDPATAAPAEFTVQLNHGLPSTAYSFYTVRHSASDPCDYIIWSSYPKYTDKNGKLWLTGTLGTIVQPGDRLAVVLLSPPSETFDPAESGPYEQVLQSEFFTVP